MVRGHDGGVSDRVENNDGCFDGICGARFVETFFSLFIASASAAAVGVKTS